MPTEPTPPSLGDLVRRAVQIADPQDEDGVLGDFEVRFEDADEPVTGIENLEERIGFGADEDPAVQVAQAVVLYLAHRRTEIDDEPDDIVRRALRAEWHDQPPPEVLNWVQERGLTP